MGTGPQRRIPTLLLALLLTLAPQGPAVSAQETFTLAGRVVSAGTDDGVSGIVLTLDDDRATGTDLHGWFRFRGVAPGEYTLRTHGIGYHPTETRVTVSEDTVVHLEVAVSPVPLAPLDVVARTVDVRGEVREAGTGVVVLDARVRHAAGGETETNRRGRFRLRDVPAEIPVPIWVEAFGFLPAATLVEVGSDTTLTFELEPDPVAQAMIQEQMRRLDQRREGFGYEPLPVMERDAILEYRDHLLESLLEFRLGFMADRIACVVVNEEPTHESLRARNLLEGLTALDLHRLELVEVPGPSRRLMLRVYTRDFVRDMVLGRARLVEQPQAMRGGAGQCGPDLLQDVGSDPPGDIPDAPGRR